MAAPVRRLSDLRARTNWLILCAPDQFPTTGSFTEDQSANLVQAFDLVRAGLPLVPVKMNKADALARLDALLNDALAAYQRGDAVLGAHQLQDFLDVVFPNRFRRHGGAP